MTEYHKIRTVWNRDPATNHRTLIGGDWATPALGYLAGVRWAWTEKVDGTNIRIVLDAEGVPTIGGKTDAAQIPAFLLPRLQHIAAAAQAAGLANMVLYGEGYGMKIQGGSKYLAGGHDFVLFDVLSTGPEPLWLERSNVDEIAGKIGIDVVPILHCGALYDAVDYARGGFYSRWGVFRAEGLVCRPVVELRDRRGERIITKIKTRDFEA